MPSKNSPPPKVVPKRLPCESATSPADGPPLLGPGNVAREVKLKAAWDAVTDAANIPATSGMEIRRRDA